MDEGKEIQGRGIKRLPITMERDCSLGAISFKTREWADHLVKIVDLSVIGLGIESDRPIEPGIIWFKESTYGQKCGLLMWCKQTDVRYRAGIEFISLTREQEEYLRQQVEQVQPHRPLQDPAGIIATLIDHVKKNIDGDIAS